jgi:hypothetical protein
MDVEMMRKKMDELYGAEGVSEAEGEDGGNLHTNQNSNRVQETRSNLPESFAKKKVKSKALSSFISTPQQGKGRGRRGSKSNMSIVTSSTTSTLKQSNTNHKSFSVNEFVHNSSWADGVKKNSELAERRMRRTRRRFDKRNRMDDHYPSTPNSDGPSRRRFPRRRHSSGDVNGLARSGSGTMVRRKFRRSISDLEAINAVVGSPNEMFLLRSKSSGPATPKPTKSTEDTASVAESAVATPYNILRDPKYRLSAKSYSDRVMIAAELQDENGGPGGSPRIPIQILQIPFPEATANTESSEKRGDDESDNKKAAQAVQAFGKSVAKSMKKQAKNTKRKIERQISKIASPHTSKSVVTSKFLVDDTAKSSTPLFDDDVLDSSYYSDKGERNRRVYSPIPLKPPSGAIPLSSPIGTIPFKPPSRMNPRDEADGILNSPLIALKPPSGHYPRAEPGFQAPGLNSIEDPVKVTGRYIPLAPLLDEPETKVSQDRAGSIVGDNQKESDRRRPRNMTGSKAMRIRRRRKKVNSKKKNDEQLESSIESGSAGDPSSSSHDSGYHGTSIIESRSNQYPIFNDEEEEASSLERSFQINTAVLEQLQPLVGTGDLTIRDDEKEVSPNYTHSYNDVSSADSSVQRDLSNTRKMSAAGKSLRSKSFSPSRRRKNIISTFSDKKGAAGEGLRSKSSNPSRRRRNSMGGAGEGLRSKSSSPSRRRRNSMGGAGEGLRSKSSSPSRRRRNSMGGAGEGLRSKSSSPSRRRSNSISTPVSSQPSSPIRARYKKNRNKIYGNRKQHDSNKFNSKVTNAEKNKKEASKIAKILATEFQDGVNSTEKVEPNANDLPSQQAVNKKVSHNKEEGRLSHTAGVIEIGIALLEAHENQKTKDDDVSVELFNLLKNPNSKREHKAKLRKKATRERLELKRRDLRRLRRQQEIVDMAITVDSFDPLEVSEITQKTVERRKSGKSHRKSVSDRNSRSEQVQAVNSTRDKGQKSRRRGSRTKRSSDKVESEAESITASTEKSASF